MFENCVTAQSLYILYKDVAPVFKIGDEIMIINKISCDHCPGGGPQLDSASITHNQKVHEWYRTAESLKSNGFKYDSLHGYYITCDSVLRLVRSEYYVAIQMYSYKNGNVFGTPNQNKSSPECKLDKGDSAVGTIRYRVVCTDCPYPKKKKLYYIFYYDKNGAAVRHGLAYLKKGKN